ncbi:MAG: transglycosylase SLT domain-containing protein [Desulfomonilaceae bacterium]
MRPGERLDIKPCKQLLSSWAVIWKLTLLGTILATISGCGSSLNLVRKDDPGSASLTGAIVKAFSFGSRNSSATGTKLGTFPPIPIEPNEPRVRKFLRQYGYEHRSTTRNYLAQAQKYLPMVNQQLREHHLPQELAYLFLLESGANPDARSRANALGMWQFMPATARSYGLRVDSYVDERLDPVKSTNAALIYLKDLYGMFGCWRLALSAYNSGENKLNRVLCKEDTDEYEDICSSRMLKRETKEFLPRFQALAIIAKNPEKYGFPSIISKKSEEKFELVPIQGSYSLDKLARVIGISYADLLEHNPALVRGITPPDTAPYSLRVPHGKKDILLAGLKNIPEEAPKRQIITHLVRRGDTVKGIIRRYGVSKEMLAQLNPDVNFSRRLKKGVKIAVPKIPVKKKVVSRTNGFHPRGKHKPQVSSAKKS